MSYFFSDEESRPATPLVRVSVSLNATPLVGIVSDWLHVQLPNKAGTAPPTYSRTEGLRVERAAPNSTRSEVADSHRRGRRGLLRRRLLRCSSLCLRPGRVGRYSTLRLLLLMMMVLLVLLPLRMLVLALVLVLVLVLVLAPARMLLLLCVSPMLLLSPHLLLLALSLPAHVLWLLCVPLLLVAHVHHAWVPPAVLRQTPSVALLCGAVGPWSARCPHANAQTNAVTVGCLTTQRRAGVLLEVRRVVRGEA
jgi:hypothetical protein